MKQDPTQLSDDELLRQYARVCARRGVRNSGLCVFLYEDAPEPNYYSEIIRRLKERRELLEARD